MFEPSSHPFQLCIFNLNLSHVLLSHRNHPYKVDLGILKQQSETSKTEVMHRIILEMVKKNGRKTLFPNP